MGLQKVVLKFNPEEWKAVVEEMEINKRTTVIELDTGRQVTMMVEGEMLGI